MRADDHRQAALGHEQVIVDLPATWIPAWMDSETAALLRDVIATVAARHPELMAVVLYGSVDRREARALHNPHPSDVDLLFVCDRDPDGCSYEWEIGVSASQGQALARHPDAPRELQVMFGSPSLSEWDPTFVANVVRDGLLLWARGPLPAPLAAVAARSEAAMQDAAR